MNRYAPVLHALGMIIMLFALTLLALWQQSSPPIPEPTGAQEAATLIIDRIERAAYRRRRVA